MQISEFRGNKNEAHNNLSNATLITNKKSYFIWDSDVVVLAAANQK
jgi:hypothetical protein